VDVSGFTALTERLAVRGKAGAEEVSDIVSQGFTALLEVAGEHGGEMLKWGGDAALLIFDGSDAALAACTATARMCELMKQVGSLRTSAGRITLRVSVGVHAGPVDLYLVGQSHRELVVTGPAATRVIQMEAIAEAGEVVLSPETAGRVPGPIVGAAKGEGLLLHLPAALSAHPASTPTPRPSPLPGVDVGSLLPPPTRAHLLGAGEPDEHRHAAVAFIEFSGVDALTEVQGPGSVATSLDLVIREVQRSSEVQGVNLHASDVGADGGKILVLGGIPVVHGNDEERVLRTALDVVDSGGGQLSLRAGVNAGRVFMHESGPVYRRIHSFAGDAVNLAARVMGKAAAGEVLATRNVLEHSRSTFETRALAPFTVKGKSQPVEASVVEGIRHGTEPGVRDDVPFMARHHELGEILSAAERAQAGDGNVVEIVAEPGMGKSVLVAEAMSRWSVRSYRLACAEYGRATPYLPIRWLLRAVLGLGEREPPSAVVTRLQQSVADAAPDLTPWLPLLGDILGLDMARTRSVEQLDPKFVRSRIEEVVTAFLAALIDEPAAIVFEDAHDLDEASRSLLLKLATEVPRRPWLLLVTRRPEGEAPLEASTPRRLLQLAPLAASEALGLLDAVAEELALSADARQMLVDRAGGNPLFIHELAVAARAAGSVDALPDRLEPLLAAKVDRLAPADRRILRAAAVLGTHFDPSLLTEVVSADGARDDALDQKAWGRLSEYLVERGASLATFSHALIRDAAYEGLSYRRRRDLHGLAADAIERRSANPEDSADLLSLHTLHAGRFDEAWRFGRVAGERAFSLYANADAVTFFSRAIEAWRQITPSLRPQTLEVAELLGDAAERAGRFEVAIDGYRLARRSTPSNVDQARLMRKTGVIYERQSRYSDALRCYTRGRKQVPAEVGDEGVERAELAIAYAASRYRQGRFRECVTWSEQAAHEAEASGHRHGLAHALYLDDQARADMAEEAGERALRALAIFEELGDLVGQGRVLNNLGRQEHQRGRWDRALDYYRRSKTLLGRVGDVVGEAVEDYNIGEILSDQGHYEEAATMLEAARMTWRAANYPIGVGVALSSLGRQATRTGDLETAAALLEEARERFEGIGAAYFLMETDGRLAELVTLGGSAEDAMVATDSFLAGLEMASGTEFLVPLGHRLRAIALFRSGRVGDAAHELSAGVASAESVSTSYELALTLAARAVIAQDAGASWADEGSIDPVADAERARSLLADLGVVDCPVTSVSDRWPGGDSAPTSQGERAGAAMARAPG